MYSINPDFNIDGTLEVKSTVNNPTGESKKETYNNVLEDNTPVDVFLFNVEIGLLPDFELQDRISIANDLSAYEAPQPESSSPGQGSVLVPSGTPSSVFPP